MDGGIKGREYIIVWYLGLMWGCGGGVDVEYR